MEAADTVDECEEREDGSDENGYKRLDQVGNRVLVKRMSSLNEVF